MHSFFIGRLVQLVHLSMKWPVKSHVWRKFKNSSQSNVSAADILAWYPSTIEKVTLSIDSLYLLRNSWFEKVYHIGILTPITFRTCDKIDFEITRITLKKCYGLNWFRSLTSSFGPPNTSDLLYFDALMIHTMDKAGNWIFMILIFSCSKYLNKGCYVISWELKNSLHKRYETENRPFPLAYRKRRAFSKFHEPSSNRAKKGKVWCFHTARIKYSFRPTDELLAHNH